MWKKSLIAIVTFLGGVYFFLEFVVPATIPWKTTSGVVLSKPTSSELEIGLVRETASIQVMDRTTMVRRVGSGALEQALPDSIRPGDLVTVTTPAGYSTTGIVMPESSPRWVKLGRVAASKTVGIEKSILIRRMRARGSGEQVGLDKLNASSSASADWVQVGARTYLSDWYDNVNDFFIVLGSMAWGMGLLSLWLVHSSNIRKRRTEWSLSVLFFAAVALGVVAGLGFGLPEDSREWTKKLSDIVMFDLLRPLGSTVFSLLAFYLASAAYRSFKAKSREAVLMMVAALTVMLGQLSLHAWLTSASTWILYIVTTGAVRAMEFGLMLSGIAIGLRLWLSLERGAFFDREV